MTLLIALAGILTAAAMVGIGGPLVRKGFTQIGSIDLKDLLHHPIQYIRRFLHVPSLVAGFLLQGFSWIPYVVALSAAKVSIVVPMTGLQYLFLVTFAHLLLREKLTVGEALSLLLIVSGVISLSFALA